MSPATSSTAERRLPLVGLVIVFFLVMALLIAGVVGLVVVGATSIGSNNAQNCSPDISGGGAITASDDALAVPRKLHEEQLKNARLIDETAAKLGLSGTASKIAIIAATGESTLLNLGYGDESKGVVNPDGSATTSKGLFQQQTSTGWGTVAQVTNPVYATTSFLLGPKHDGSSQGLVTVPGWETGEITLVIHRVQANADPNHYAASYGAAEKIIREAGIDVDRPADESKQQSWRKNAARAVDASAPAGGDQGSLAGFDGCALGAAGKSGNGKNSYPWDRLAPPPGVYNVDPLRFYYGECTSYAAWKVNEAMGGSASNIIFDNGYGGRSKGNGADWKRAWEDLGWKVSNTPKAGSVAWWGANGGEGVGSAGHVAWVDEVTPDGKVVISEYNNSYYAPPGHKYSRRPNAIDPGQVNAYLYVPEKK